MAHAPQARDGALIVASAGVAAPRYADSHVHLDRFSPSVRRGLLRRACGAGVDLLLAVGMDLRSSRTSARMAGRSPGENRPTIWAAAGLHPLRVRRDAYLRELDGLERLAIAYPHDVRAIGEIGLDAAADRAAHDAVTHAFDWQLRLAARLYLPVVLHAAGAHQEAARMLAPRRSDIPAVIVHYFMGDAADLRRYLDLDCQISFGRPVTKPEGGALRDLSRAVPLERLLAETDTYPLPGRSTEPRDVVGVVQALAAARDVEVREVAAATRANLQRVLSLRDDGAVAARSQVAEPGRGGR